MKLEDLFSIYFKCFSQPVNAHMCQNWTRSVLPTIKHWSWLIRWLTSWFLWIAWNVTCCKSKKAWLGNASLWFSSFFFKGRARRREIWHVGWTPSFIWILFSNWMACSGNDVTPNPDPTTQLLHTMTFLLWQIQFTLELCRETQSFHALWKSVSWIYCYLPQEQTHVDNIYCYLNDSNEFSQRL